MTWLAQAQPLFLAAVFGWSGTSKTLGGAPGGRVAGTALHRLLGGRLAPAAYYVLGVAEIALAVCLLVAPGRPSALTAAVLSCGFIAYLGYAAVATPQASCGCLGKRKVRQSWRGFARAGLLLAAALVAATGAPAWWHHPPLVPVALSLLAEAALFIVLSAELDNLWLYPLRRLRIRLTHPLSGAPDVVPLQATVSVLVRSDVWRETSHLVASDILDHWDTGGHRILVYSARTADGDATAVFAVPLDGDATGIRFTLVEDQEAPAVR
jgi:hypothetical protein